MVFDPAAHPTGINVLLGTYAFAFQIYGDFAGYSNIARGTSKLMGIELIENFRFPYLVRSATGVLASLAHQPVHVAARLPVHPARRQPRLASARTRRNLLITMVLGGLWHGAAWTFVLWGVYHGLLLIAYRAADRVRSLHAWIRGRGALARVTSWAVMFHLTCYGWLIFRRAVGAAAGDHDREACSRLRAAAPWTSPRCSYRCCSTPTPAAGRPRHARRTTTTCWSCRSFRPACDTPFTPRLST